MLTRAYDAIMASFQVPMITYENVDFNTSAIDDSVLNCKDGNGVIKSIVSPTYISNSSGKLNVLNLSVSYIPFSSFSNSSPLIPDEDSSDPNYEDYSCSTSPSGWHFSSTSYPIKKTYDESTKEFVCSTTCLWQNTSGSAKTVYGVKVVKYHLIRQSYNSTNVSGSGVTSPFLLCREHFAAPVVVEDQGIISLTFTWRVGRAGLVSATAAAAE